MDLSVVIPARNEADTIGLQLEALQAQVWQGTWEVLVVDNGSTDATADRITAFGENDERIRLVAHEGAPGACTARNVGVGLANSEFIAFCDADDVVAPGWLQAMFESLQTSAIVTGPLELDKLNPTWIVESRGRSGAVDLPHFFGIFPHIRGNNFGAQRSAYEALGGLDQSTFGAEELDFGLRAWLAGIEIGYSDASLVHYRYRTAPRELWRQGFTYGVQRPKIRRRLKELGLAAPPPLSGWKSWLALVVGLPRALTPHGRALTCWGAGNRFGHLLGSIRARTLLL